VTSPRVRRKLHEGLDAGFCGEGQVEADVVERS